MNSGVNTNYNTEDSNGTNVSFSRGLGVEVLNKIIFLYDHALCSFFAAFLIETYKNKEGIVTLLKHKGSNIDNSTYIVEMNSSTQPDKKFTFEILGKYIQKVI